MPASAAQVAANRRNALKSCGPRTPEGRDAVRHNAVTHGCRSDPAALPNEDPHTLELRCRAWNEQHQPQTAESQHLVNECARASLLSDRVDAYNHAQVSAQILDAELAWENDRSDDVETHIGRLKGHPEEAREALAETAAGCRWLVLQWEALLQALDSDGKWTRSERSEALRLMGRKPGKGLKRDPAAWEIWLLGALMPVNVPDDEIARGFQDDRMPRPMQARYQLDRLPRYTEAAERLVGLIRAEVEALRQRAEWLHENVDVPERAAAAQRAMILEGDKGRLFLRYLSEARNTFHRACKALRVALRDEREALSEPVERAPGCGDEWSPNKPNSEPAAAADRPDEVSQPLVEPPVIEPPAAPPAAAGSAKVNAPLAYVGDDFLPPDMAEFLRWARSVHPEMVAAAEADADAEIARLTAGMGLDLGAPLLRAAC